MRLALRVPHLLLVILQNIPAGQLMLSPYGLRQLTGCPQTPRVVVSFLMS
jgi:alkylated DNA nucleotide flippase Atl1